MSRLLLGLPLCLLVASHHPEPSPRTGTASPLQTAEGVKDALPVDDPVAFLGKCLERYDQSGIKGYHCTFRKQERLGGELKPSEDIDVFFREEPHSVFFNWQKGQRKANRALFVEGENGGKMLANPAGLAGRLVKVVERDVDGEDAKQSGRYTLRDFGLKKACQRSYKAWKAAQDNGTLQAEYLGVHKVREAGDRPCYVVRRVCAKPEDDGVVTVTLYIDKEHWLQVGSILKDGEGKLIGEYFFRDIRFNPEFKPEQFERSSLTP